MSDDPTRDLPGDRKQIIDEQNDDRINVLISAVQSLATSFQALSAEFQEVKARITALEKTVNERSYETKPIWERALDEIAATRAELKEMRAELKETRAELKETRAELKETKTDLRAELKDGFRKLGAKMDVLNNDLLTVRGDHRLLEKRVEDLESKAS